MHDVADLQIVASSRFSISRVFCVTKTRRCFMVAWRRSRLLVLRSRLPTDNPATGRPIDPHQTCLSSDPVVSRADVFNRSNDGPASRVSPCRPHATVWRKLWRPPSDRSQWIHLAGRGNADGRIPQRRPACLSRPVTVRRTVCPAGSIRQPCHYWFTSEGSARGQLADRRVEWGGAAATSISAVRVADADGLNRADSRWRRQRYSCMVRSLRTLSCPAAFIARRRVVCVQFCVLYRLR